MHFLIFEFVIARKSYFKPRKSGQIVTVTHRHIVVFRFGKNGPITTLRTKEGIER